MLWRVVETYATQPPQFAEKRKRRVCPHDGRGPYSGVKHHEAFGEKAMRQQENRRTCVRSTRLTFLSCYEDLLLD